MGSLGAASFAEQVDQGNVSLTAALSWHLFSNHFPAVPAAFVPTCLAAIEAGQEEDWGRDIALPKGCSTHHEFIAFDGTCESEDCEIVRAVLWKDNRDVASAGALIESFHLDSFL